MNISIKIKMLTTFILIYSSMNVYAEQNETETVLATVNGKNITLGHIINAVTGLPPEYQNLEDDYLLKGVLDQVIKQEVMSQILDVSKNRVKISVENETRSIRAKFAVEKEMEGFPTENQIRDAYQTATLSLKNVEEFNASHILIESENEAKELVDLLKSGSNFSDLAKEKSTGPSAPSGGNLGWFGPGQMVPEFEAAVLVLEVADTSQPVQTQFGWHIIKLNDRRKKQLPSIEELRPEIIQRLSQSKVEEILNAAASKATIVLSTPEINPNLIRRFDLLEK
jgi:peptidyl-prolyl cis-trans isomerase C